MSELLPLEGFELDTIEDIYSLDLDSIDRKSLENATTSIKNLIQLYNNKKFIEDHPEFKKRIDSEIESLRKYYKMSETNESIHDHLATAISNNPNNASLYTALTRLQSNMIQIDEKIRACLNEFNKLCTSYQTEINFEREDDELSNNTFKGTKQFIKSTIEE